MMIMPLNSKSSDVTSETGTACPSELTEFIMVCNGSFTPCFVLGSCFINIIYIYLRTLLSNPIAISHDICVD